MSFLQEPHQVCSSKKDRSKVLTKTAGQWWEIIAKYRAAFKSSAFPGTNTVVAALWISCQCQLSLRNGQDKKAASLFHWHFASRNAALLAQTPLFTSILDTSSPGSDHCPYHWEKQQLSHSYFLLYSQQQHELRLPLQTLICMLKKWMSSSQLDFTSEVPRLWA